MSEQEAQAIESREGNQSLLVPEDDYPHTPETDGWFEHETYWWMFFVPERKIMSWIYHYVRPNIGVSGGGVFICDDTAWNHMEVPYYLNYSNMPPPEVRDGDTLRFANRHAVQTLEPLKRYRLTYSDRDIISFDLDWNAIMDPWVRVNGEPAIPRHLDQFGHVTGTLNLHGEEIPVDCYAMRDRSWLHIRPEPWKDGAGGGGYITACAGPETSFYGAGPGGFLVLDGVRQPLVEGSFRRERDPEHGFIRRIIVEGKDSEGRPLEAIGDAVSRVGFPISGAAGVCWQSLVKYTINGIPAWGDDQDAWSINMWSAFRRTSKGLKDVREKGLQVLR